MPEYNPDTDPRSSNSLIRAYLASKGLPLNGENVRRALEANNANRGTIPGLVNSLPSTEAEDQAAMAARGGGGGGAGGSSGGNRTTSASPRLPAAAQDTSAAPGAASGGSGDGDGFPWLAAAAGGAGAALAPLLNRLRGAGASNTRVPGAPGEPSFDIGDIQLSMNRPGLAPPVDVGGQQVNLGRQPRLLPSAAQPSLGAGIVNGEPLSIGAPAPQLPAPAPQLPAPQSVDARPVANPNEAMPMRGPGPPDVIPLPGQRVQPIMTPEQFVAANPATANVPAAEVAPAGVRAPRRVRAPRIRVP